MNTKDLEIFLVLAETENMQQAAQTCDKTPSMLSKSLKRLEQQLGVTLFDRVGKHIKLNAAGIKLRFNAAKIVAQTRHTIAECSGMQANTIYRIAAPSIVLFRWASVLSKTLLAHQHDSTIHFQTHYEQEALNQLLQGQADIALITSEIAAQIPASVITAPLGQLTMQIAAGKNHPLVAQAPTHDGTLNVTIEQLLAHSFVSPTISPYCGENRGLGCDGWPNEQHPRKLNTVANDYAVLGQLVKTGQALAYIPDYWLRELDLIQITPSSGIKLYKEEIIIASLQPELIALFSEN